MTTGVSALLIDALGTLVRLEPPAPRLRAELADRFGVEVSEAQAGTALLAEIHFYRDHMGAGRDAASLAALRARCAEVLREALPPSERLARVGGADLTAALLAALEFNAFDDARQAIVAARNRGRRVVVASNWDVSLHEVLERIGLAPLVDGVVTSAEVGARKPAPIVFERALALAGVAPSAALHVGDSVEEDVRGALAAGIEPVLLSRDGREAPPGVRRIASLTELDCP
jgi:putative hydrolase of the HAD superfamily